MKGGGRRAGVCGASRGAARRGERLGGWLAALIGEKCEHCEMEHLSPRVPDWNEKGRGGGGRPRAAGSEV